MEHLFFVFVELLTEFVAVSGFWLFVSISVNRSFSKNVLFPKKHVPNIILIVKIHFICLVLISFNFKCFYRIQFQPFLNPFNLVRSTKFEQLRVILTILVNNKSPGF